MASDLVNCPYCNSATVPPPGALPGQRIACGRCGESFVYRVSEESPGGAAPPLAPELPVQPAAPRRLKNRDIALAVLGVMAVMAALGLIYALSTQALRRSYDTNLPKTRAIDVPLLARIALGLYVAGLVGAIVWGWNRSERARGAAEKRSWMQRLSVPGLAALSLIGIGLALVAIQARPVRPALEPPKAKVAALAPADLAALGYLPDDTDLIAAVHVAELLDDPSGSDLLKRFGLGSQGGVDLEKWTGLKLDDIDHAVLGLKLDGDLLTRFTLVVRARGPIDQQHVREVLKATAPLVVDGRPVYPSVDGRPVSPFVLETGLPLVSKLGVSAWFADDKTLIVAKTFDRIPLTPKTGIDHLRPELRQVIRERMGPSGQLWVAAHTDSWQGVNFFVRQALNDRLDKGAETFKQVRTLALWLTTGDGVTLRGAFDSADEKAARGLAAYLDPANKKGARSLFDGPDEGPMARGFVESLKTTQKGTWVDLQARAEIVRGAK